MLYTVVSGVKNAGQHVALTAKPLTLFDVKSYASKPTLYDARSGKCAKGCAGF